MTTKTHPFIIIVILNWNGKEDTLECLTSVKKLDYSNYEIVLVDNGSVDGSVDAVSKTDSLGTTYVSHSAPVCVDLASAIFVPDAFTPNGDGVNDEFKASFAFDPVEFTLIIYNRYGGVVFESENVGQGWEGLLKGGTKAPQGVYVYFITYRTESGQKMNKKGSFSLIYP